MPNLDCLIGSTMRPGLLITYTVGVVIKFLVNSHAMNIKETQFIMPIPD